MNILRRVKPYISKDVISYISRHLNRIQLRSSPSDIYEYRPTFYMKNAIFQLVYGACQPKLKLKYHRDKIYQEDGGHITLDWYIDKKAADLT